MEQLHETYRVGEPFVSEMVDAAVIGGVAPKDALARAASRADQELTRAQKG